MENIPNIDPKKMALINEFKKMAEGKKVKITWIKILERRNENNN